MLQPDPTVFARAVETARLPRVHTLIDGMFVDGGGQIFTDVFPATGTQIAEVRSSSPGQVSDAVSAARQAFPAWADSSATTRAAILDRAADTMLRDMDRLTALVTLDNGKTSPEASFDVVSSTSLTKSAAGWASRMRGSTLPLGDGYVEMTWREPVGVVAIFMPFNAPLMFCAMKIAAAIAMGNTVVVKSPEKSPLAAIAFAEYLVEAGLPNGVVNIVQGSADVGTALVSSPEVDMVSFTGSSTVGARVGSDSVAGLKRVLLELGGKSANIIFDDAPFDSAVEGSVGAIFRNSGQRCFSGSRILVQENIADRFIESLVAKTRSLRVGDPFDPNSDIGSLITAQDVSRVRSIVRDAEEAGAKVLCGGDSPTGATPESGYFLPTVIDVGDLTDLAILREETFGPVVTVQRFTDTNHAIDIANTSEYGLAGGCWTSDLAKALTVARRIETGYFWINSYAGAAGPESTIGGRKSSGFGTEKGEDGMLAYTAIKTVIMSESSTGTVIPMGGR